MHAQSCGYLLVTAALSASCASSSGSSGGNPAPLTQAGDAGDAHVTGACSVASDGTCAGSTDAVSCCPVRGALIDTARACALPAGPGVSDGHGTFACVPQNHACGALMQVGCYSRAADGGRQVLVTETLWEAAALGDGFGECDDAEHGAMTAAACP